MRCPACDHPAADDARFCASCGERLPAAAAPAELDVGTEIAGRYRLVRVLGRGGMGVVYEAEQRLGTHTRRVAVKLLLPELSDEPKLRGRFLRECGIVSALEHPHTVSVFDFGETADGRLYIVMELVLGVSLGDVIASGPQPVARVQHILRQVCAALQEAHDRGIVHRDLKPENIILTRRGEDDFVKLLDFGIAAYAKAVLPGSPQEHRTRLTEVGVVLGTPPYMSPEQISGQPLDARSDVYSLGIIAYELLTGRLPLEAETPWEWARRHFNEPPLPFDATPAGARVPPLVRDAVLAALAKRPADRPESARAFSDLLLGVQRPVAGGRALPATDPVGPRTPGTELAWPPPPAPVAGVPAAFPGKVPSPAWGQLRTDSVLLAPVPRHDPRASLWWLAVALPLVALVLASGAVGVAYVATQRDEGPVVVDVPSSPPVTVLQPDHREAPTPALAPPTPALDPEVEPPAATADRPKTPAKPAPSPMPTEPRRRPPGLDPKPPTTPPAPPATTPAPPATTPAPPATPPAPPATTPPPPATTPAPTTPPAPAAPTGDAACTQAKRQADRGAIEAAVALHQQCAATGGSGAELESTRRRIEGAAPAVVERRAFTGDCDGARRVVSSASSIGAGSRAAAKLASLSACR